jgi:hypothetical protein
MATPTPSSVPAGFTFEQLMEAFCATREEIRQSREKSDAEWQKQQEEWRQQQEKSDAEWQKKQEEWRQQQEKSDAEWQKKQEKSDAEWQKRQEEWRQKQEKSDAEWLEIKALQRENARYIKEVGKKISELGDRIGELVEVMVEGGIVRKFRELGYTFSGCARRYEFENKQLNIAGEIDLFLENGNDALAVEVKTNLTISDVKTHIKRMEKFRRYADARNDKRQFVAAVGGGIVRKEVREYALKQGIYVITQSGETVEIVPLPKGFKAKIW